MSTYGGYEEYHKHPVFNGHRALLENLSDEERVVEIGYDEDKKEFFIVERCDEYFCHTLTKQDCIELSELFKKISEAIK